MLTTDDHALLASYSALPILTPEQAAHIKRCMPHNSYLDPHRIRWWHPAGDDGYPILGESKHYDHPIRKVKLLPPKAVRQPSPASLNSQSPWLDEGISRTTWFMRQAQQPKQTAILSVLPDWAQGKEGLKLYTALAAVCALHKLNIKWLWEQVGEVLRGASTPLGEEPADPETGF